MVRMSIFYYISLEQLKNMNGPIIFDEDVEVSLRIEAKMIQESGKMPELILDPKMRKDAWMILQYLRSSFWVIIFSWVVVQSLIIIKPTEKLALGGIGNGTGDSPIAPIIYSEQAIKLMWPVILIVLLIGWIFLIIAKKFWDKLLERIIQGLCVIFVIVSIVYSVQIIPYLLK